MADRPHDQARHEAALERADRSFAELLQEPRVNRTGAQILFAFLAERIVAPRVPTPDTVQRATSVER